MVDPDHLTRLQSEAVARSRRGRNWAVLIVLVLLALLFYALAFVKLSGH